MTDASALAVAAGASVYNICLPLLERANPDRPPFRLVELDAGKREGS